MPPLAVNYSQAWEWGIVGASDRIFVFFTMGPAEYQMYAYNPQGRLWSVIPMPEPLNYSAAVVITSYNDTFMMNAYFTLYKYDLNTGWSWSYLNDNYHGGGCCVEDVLKVSLYKDAFYWICHAKINYFNITMSLFGCLNLTNSNDQQYLIN